MPSPTEARRRLLLKVFNLLGSVYVTLPVRIAVVGLPILRRRGRHLAAFAAAVVISEVLIGTLKGIYDRARPTGSLIATSGASFPSGLTVAASVTVVAAVIARFPRQRAQPAMHHSMQPCSGTPVILDASAGGAVSS